MPPMTIDEKRELIEYFEKHAKPLLKKDTKYFSLGYNTAPLTKEQTDKLVDRLKSEKEESTDSSPSFFVPSDNGRPLFTMEELRGDDYRFADFS